ncbi:cathepsin 8-like [Pleurodeles waltl]|uniref:cathepsin 8-like n=1 Tax=Pleurodeles waltl TaxID=8319 RepID=UPI003709438D
MDYHGLNAVTKTDAHLIPRAEELIDRLGAAKFLSTFGLTSGYSQFALTDGVKERSPFSTLEGHYQFRIMPYGMKHALATFQRLVNQVLARLEDFSAAYLDDSADFSWEDHLHCLCNTDSNHLEVLEYLSATRKGELGLDDYVLFRMQVMQAVLLLPALLAISFASKHLDEEWEMWKSKYGKKYLTADDEEFRRSAWEATWHKVRDHNLLADRGNKSFRLEMNHFADLTTHERNSRGCFRAPRSAEKPTKVDKLYRTAFDLPKEVDWRGKNCVTKPKNEGSLCKSGWAFTTVGVIETRFCIKYKALFDLSEQQLVDCDTGSEGCCEGSPLSAFKYVSTKGIMMTEDYEYIERANKCAYESEETIDMVISKFYVLPDESTMLPQWPSRDQLL